MNVCSLKQILAIFELLNTIIRENEVIIDKKFVSNLSNTERHPLHLKLHLLLQILIQSPPNLIKKKMI